MKAAGSITHPTGDAVPIFADPAREYAYARRVRRYRRIDRGGRFFVVSNEDEEMLLDLRFVAPEVLRVRFHHPKEEPPLASPTLVEHFERPVDVLIRLRAGKIVLATEAVELHVVRKPFHFGLFDRQGRLVFVQQIADVAPSGLVCFPLGYSRDGQGRVGFHESFELEAGERIFGLDSQRGTLDKRGQRLVTTDVADGVAPFFWSSRGYGVFVHHAGKIVFELGFPSTITGSFQVDDSYLDYFLIYGPAPQQILARCTDLAGA
jgi:alpha-D-xyloside xylohydrolase